eukprot:COSAG02_NODE_3874_length_6107_cov_7.362350_8_plen_64_part_00
MASLPYLLPRLLFHNGCDNLQPCDCVCAGALRRTGRVFAREVSHKLELFSAKEVNAKLAAREV